MRKFLITLLFGLLFSNSTIAKIIKFEECFTTHFAESFNDFSNGNITESSFTINLDTAKVVSRLNWTKEHKEKWDIRFISDTFEITNYDNDFVYAQVNYSSGGSELLSLNLSTGEVYVQKEGFTGSAGKPYIKQCNLKNTSNDKSPKGPSSGTAFFVSNRGHLLTNNHVVEGCSISKITYKNKDYDTKLLATDKTLDLALLKADIRPKSFFNFSKDDVKKLNKVYVAGYPLGKGLSDDLKISSGIVSSLKGFEDNSNEIQIDAPINPGNSGGPIINENGDLIAIAVSGLAKDQTEGINFGIKSSAAETFLRSNKINPKKSMYAGIKDNDKLLEILEEGTVYTYCN